MNYGEYGNEVLAPLAYGGDYAAKAELELRGNEVDKEKKVLRKRFRGDQIYPAGRFKAEDTVVVENGRVVGTVEEIDRLGYLVAQAASLAVEAGLAEAAVKLEEEEREALRVEQVLMAGEVST